MQHRPPNISITARQNQKIIGEVFPCRFRYACSRAPSPSRLSRCAHSAPAQAAYPERTITVVCASAPAARWTSPRASSPSTWRRRWDRTSSCRTSPAPAARWRSAPVGKAAPDGYTLLTIGPSVGTIKELFPKATVDAERDLAPVYDHRPDADGAGGQQGRARHRLQVAARLHQGASRRTDVRQQRPRLGRPSRRLAVQENGGRRHPLHPLPHDAAGDRRPDRRPHLDDLAVVARQSRRLGRGALVRHHLGRRTLEAASRAADLRRAWSEGLRDHHLGQHVRAKEHARRR